MSQKIPKNKINGVLLLDKPQGLSSNAALQKVKRLCHAKKAGHTGSLDPLATGMLPLCFGEATKFSQYLLEADKIYQVTAKLGVRTNTSDAEGTVISQRPVPSFTKAQLEGYLEHFRGEIEQTPSIFSALKYQGKPLYEYARAGIEVPRPTRTITVYDLQLISMKDDELQLEIHCSKGTYIRTIIDDLGELMGCGAHVIVLHRSKVGPYQAKGMVSLTQLEQLFAEEADAAEQDRPDSETVYRLLTPYLLPLSSSVAHWPQLNLKVNEVLSFQQGQTIVLHESFSADLQVGAMVQAMTESDEFIGVAEVIEPGKIAPRRLLDISR